MNTVTATITIGRNVGVIPMYDAEWAAFQNAVQVTLENVKAEIHVKYARGRGSWTDAEGVTVEEDNATWVAGLNAADVDEVRYRLSRLAFLYLQDAIAYTVGTTDLVSAF